jgi:phosphatidyl-myo-inositol dimannoside synthase
VLDVIGRALLLSPSRGLGGGIERYVETLEWAFGLQGVEYQRVDLRQPGIASHAQLLVRAREQLRDGASPVRIIAAHRALLPAAALLAREHAVCGISVVCHGSDVWGARLAPRWYIENRLMAHSNVRVVAASSFTAGALSGSCEAAILPPGLSLRWFQELVEASELVEARDTGLRLVTAFRLGDWQDKGLPELLDAIAALGRTDVHLTVCGNGEPPVDLIRLVREHERCTLRAGLTDSELARQLAAADLFVLATRTRTGRNASGEGFGLVLLEAQVAGTPVIGPAYGGSHDAYLDRITGVAPTDETAEALASVLDELLQDPGRLSWMGRQGAEWARESFAPKRYAELAVARLL